MGMNPITKVRKMEDVHYRFCETGGNHINRRRFQDKWRRSATL